MVTKKTVTKSIRLTPDESLEIEKLAGMLPTSSESALIKEAYRQGLCSLKMQAAVATYTERNFSLGEVAEMYNLSAADLSQELIRRGVKLMEGITREQADANIDRLMQRHFRT